MIPVTRLAFVQVASFGLLACSGTNTPENASFLDNLPKPGGIVSNSDTSSFEDNFNDINFGDDTIGLGDPNGNNTSALETVEPTDSLRPWWVYADDSGNPETPSATFLNPTDDETLLFDCRNLVLKVQCGEYEHCVWDPETSLCLFVDDADMPSSSDKTDTGSMPVQESMGCDVIEDSGECNVNGLCNWDRSSDFCYDDFECDTYGGESTCDANIDCTWDSNNECLIDHLRDGCTEESDSVLAAYESSKTWDDARDACIERGGFLAELEDSDQNEAALNICKETEDDRGCWLGLHKDPDTWEWADNTGLDYENWSPGQPSSNASECGWMTNDDIPAFADEGEWDDTSCSLTFAYVCRLECGDDLESAVATEVVD